VVELRDMLQEKGLSIEGKKEVLIQRLIEVRVFPSVCVYVYVCTYACVYVCTFLYICRCL